MKPLTAAEIEHKAVALTLGNDRWQAILGLTEALRTLVNQERMTWMGVPWASREGETVRIPETPYTQEDYKNTSE